MRDDRMSGGAQGQSSRGRSPDAPNLKRQRRAPCCSRTEGISTPKSKGAPQLPTARTVEPGGSQIEQDPFEGGGSTVGFSGTETVFNGGFIGSVTAYGEQCPCRQEASRTAEACNDEFTYGGLVGSGTAQRSANGRRLGRPPGAKNKPVTKKSVRELISQTATATSATPFPQGGSQDGTDGGSIEETVGSIVWLSNRMSEEKYIENSSKRNVSAAEVRAEAAHKKAAALAEAARKVEENRAQRRARAQEAASARVREKTFWRRKRKWRCCERRTKPAGRPSGTSSANGTSVVIGECSHC